MSGHRQTRGVHRRRSATLEKTLEAWELRAQGYSLRDIAKLLKLSGPQAASNLVEQGFKDFYSPKVSQKRDECDARQLMAIHELSKIAFGKKVASDKRIAALSELRKWDREVRMLHGLDAPTQSVSLTAEMPSKDVREQLLHRVSALVAAAGEADGDSETDRGDPQPH